MFDSPGPRVFSLPCGSDFPRHVVEGLRARFAGHPPDAMARVTLFVNSDRMARAMRAAFDNGAPCLLPRLRLVTDLADPLDRLALPTPEPPLRRRLEVAGLVTRLIDAAPDLAPRAAAFDLADSLVSLMEEMRAEDVHPDVLSTLDVSDQSGHWQRALRFLGIVTRYFETDAAPDAGSYARVSLERLLRRWAALPPDDPVIVAGSTGSRGTTHALMQAVAALPQGALILPGFDVHMPTPVWDRLTKGDGGEDHPQYRFATLMNALSVRPSEVRLWHDTAAPNPGRNAVVSLALRPAPVTHQWLSEGPTLSVLPKAMAEVTLLEAATTREEAQAIALRLRKAAQDGTRAALISPDRMLTRQVTAALDRWDITPDDSAGTPAHLTPPGRLLRQAAALFSAPLSSEALLALLKHPLTNSGPERGPHQLNTATLELTMRRDGWAFPSPEALRAWGKKKGAEAWSDWVAETLCDRDSDAIRPLADWVSDHVSLAEAIAAGPALAGSGALWEQPAGRTVRRVTDDLVEQADFGADMTARDYVDLFGAVLTREEHHDRDAGHPHILIWGTLEARVMGADLVILAGLTEGSWPGLPGADPWLNRKMRAEAGLLLPERQIGLAAHDFQQAAGAGEIWLTRALKSDEAETVPSRWLNRLLNLIDGLPERDGPRALAEMRARGQHWLALAQQSEAPILSTPEPRPSPAPPANARPRKLPVTAIKRLIRDPYAIYARYVLNLRALDPLMRPPDALVRGILTHEVLESFVKTTLQDPDTLSEDRLRAASSGIVGNPKRLPFPTARVLWQARIARVAAWFVATEQARQAQARPTGFEIDGATRIDALDFTLIAKADRIDLDDRGGAHLYDYKTGAAPTAKQQKTFDKQLLLQAAMLERGAFGQIDARHVAAATFLSLAPSDPRSEAAPLDETPPGTVWEDFTRLMTAYADPAKGFTARRALQKDSDIADYDHLSRFGEWDVTDAPQTEALT